MPTEYVHTCECGRKWTVRKVELIVRDNDSESCSCGRLIIEWNGGHLYLVTEIKDDDPPRPL